MPVDMKQVIARTFMKLVKEKGLDSVTVKSLVEACNISRQTFYYHFQDIMEVIEWSLEQSRQRMLERTLSKKTPQEAMAVIVEETVGNQEMISALLNSHRREQMERMFLDATRIYLQRLLEARTSQLQISYGDMEILLDFWACGLTGVLLKLCRQKNVHVEQVSGQICRVLSRRLIDLPERF